MGEINITIDGREISVPEGITVLDAARLVNVNIPTLCYLEEINEIGACRLCLVEVGGALTASCVTPVAEGMEIKTNTPRVREARKTVLELLISDHPMECLTCARNGKCELQSLAKEYGINNIEFEGERRRAEKDTSSPSIVRDTEKCILCRRCEAVCDQIQGVKALGALNRGFETSMVPTWKLPLDDVACTYCGQCIHACPTGAITEKDDTGRVWEALADPDKFVLVQTAPAVRVAIGEEFGLEPGTLVKGQMVTALRRLGFDRVFDTNFGADLTIMEEGHELIARLEGEIDGKLPMITSCSPGWIKYIEHFYPELLEHLSTCKSPHQMLGALAKTYYAEKEGIDPESMFVVSIMPCTAKKFEITRPEMGREGIKDVDAVLTTREAARMIKEAGLDFINLPEEAFDNPLGISTGAGTIFGATGGVMEAALRTAYEVVTGQELTKLEFEEIRGFEGIKEAEVDLKGKTLKVAVAHGLGNARKLLERVKAGEEFHFIEIMACPGGCIGGGGQPIPTNEEVVEARVKGLYQDDRMLKIRKSHENPAIQDLYKEYLGKPLGDKSHHLLHTTYQKRGRYPKNYQVE